MINETLKLEFETKTYINVDGVQFPLDQYSIKKLISKGV